MTTRLWAGAIALVAGAGLELIVARMWWVVSNPPRHCDPVACRDTPAFLPYATIGVPIGVVVVVTGLWALDRSLR